MSQLCYKPDDYAAIRGRSKVYFCCHPLDFELYFEEISNEILAKHKCSVWYHKDPIIEYTDEFFESLEQMKLFVIPVTSRFLDGKNPALITEFRFARENDIPVLPLMQENGLVDRFNELCGDIQFLDKYNEDSTCIRYDEKLDKFLSSLLLGDEMIKKIQDAFDAYVFLSYRKKDRSLALELMRLIHKNEFCRDIAIWFDEFLVPGENFNTAIQEALLKSDLFVLTVTPNLVNEDNYIMKTEFPMARDSNKPILPCEMKQTDKELLKKKFDKIPPCTNARKELLLAEELLGKFRDIAERGNDNDPEHIFFIGLAYLNGIDVEVDRPRGLELIRTAADKGLPEAIEKLIDIYTRGDGVKIDCNTALEWRKKLLEIRKQEYSADQNYTTAYAYAHAIFELSNACYDMDNYEEARRLANKLKDVCRKIWIDIPLDKLEDINIKRHVALAEFLLGEISHAENHLKDAMEHYTFAEKTYREINLEIWNSHILMDTAILNDKIAQLHKVNANYSEALKYYDEALKIQDEIITRFDREEVNVNKAFTLIRLSEINRLIGDINSANLHCIEALSIIDKQIDLRGDRSYVGIKITILLYLAESYRLFCDFDNALKTYNTIADLEERFIELFDEIPLLSRVERLAKTSQVYFQLRNFPAVIKYGERAIDLIEGTNVINDAEIAAGNTVPLTSYLFTSIAYSNFENDINTAMKYMSKGVAVADKCLERGIACNFPDFAMVYSFYCELLRLQGHPERAVETLKRVESVFESLRTDTVRDIGAVYSIYSALGTSYLACESFDLALEYLKKAEDIYTNIILSSYLSNDQNTNTDYAMLCFLIGLCYAISNNKKSNSYFEKCIELYGKIPEDTYTVNDWNTLGVSIFQLYSTAGIIRRKRWEKPLVYVIDMMVSRFPDQYKETYLYELLGDTGAFD